MSFFDSLHQYVSSGVASLSLSPRRASLGRHESEEARAPEAHAPGFPKVVPAPGTVCSPRPLRRSGEWAPPAGLGPQAAGLGPPRRGGSFRYLRSPSTASSPHFSCRRRQSWPEFDQHATSGVQETDGSFFESFTALAWKQQNRRLLIQQELEKPLPPHEDPQKLDVSLQGLDELYVEALCTIKNKVGSASGQYPHYQDELYRYVADAFRSSPQRHHHLLSKAAQEKPPILVLNVVVIEAENLEAKDPNGFSDPFCMLGIQPGHESPVSPNVGPDAREPPPSPRLLSARAYSDCGQLDSECKQTLQSEKLRKHHSFRLSFKRRDTLGIRSAVPAKFIRATSVRPHTLNPRWNEAFRFDIDDVSSDILHLDIWDHDDESSVLDAVSNLNQVRGVKGLGRFFKQIAQSARAGSQDDFLGCINTPLLDIPSTGLDRWYKLEARSQRSNIQGRIHLKLWLSTREDRGTSEEDNLTALRQQEQLYRLFIAHEIQKHKGPPWEWGAEIPRVASTILHQHAIQGDISELQLAVVRWIAYSATFQLASLHPRVLLRLLKDLDELWGTESLIREVEEWLAESFLHFMDHVLGLVKRIRTAFPTHEKALLSRFECALQCLAKLSEMRALNKCCPFHKDVRAELMGALKRGTAEWFDETRRRVLCSHIAKSNDGSLQCLTRLVSVAVVSLQAGLHAYQPLFERANGISYFNAVYKQLDKMVFQDLGPLIQHCCNPKQGNQIASIAVFELYLAIQEFVGLQQHLTPGEHQLATASSFPLWFLPSVRHWLALAQDKALGRVRAAMELSRVVTGERIVRHSTASVDITACFLQIQAMWRQLAWPDPSSLGELTERLALVVTSAALFFSELLQQRLQDSGYYEDAGPLTSTDEMCVCVNDLECVRRALGNVAHALSEDEAPGGSFDEANVALEARATQVTSRVAYKMRPAVAKAMFHLAWSPEALPATEAIGPLLTLLDAQLGAVNTVLLPRNFERVLADVWDTVLLELGLQVDSSAGDRMLDFYVRLQDSLQLLVNFFHAEEKGLSADAIHSSTFKEVELRLMYHCAPTDYLMTTFYQERLQEQLKTEQTPFGVLSVRVYLNHDSLSVEVLSARDVIPLDPNGFSDPFVIIELLPRGVFPACTPQQTNVHKKTLHPVFDECFEFSVTLEQCRSEGAMILFTVMDHDVLTSNDFAGEAFLSLHVVPGVADSPRPDNFHGLKTHHLCLLQQANRNHPILQTLETRKGDREAQAFVKNQRLRNAAAPS